MFGFLKNLLSLGGPELSSEDLANGTVVDVRTPGEFQRGHVANSINIPLQQLDQNMQKLRKLKTPLILCCASGNRSGIAYRKLEPMGILSLNGGSWQNVNKQITS